MKLLDLFCGCGGASDGYSQAGLEVTVAVDNDPVALASHYVNHPTAEHLTIDLEDPSDLIFMLRKGEFDVVHGSPPCVQFSQANNNPDPKRGMELIHSFERIVGELKPTWFVMENVQPVMKFLNGFYPRRRVINAADFGVPQIRKRAFCGNFPDPLPTHARRARMTLDGRRLEQWVGAGRALGLDQGKIHTGRDQRPDGHRQTRDTAEPAPTVTAMSGRQWNLVSKHCVGGQKGTRATRTVDDPAFTVNTNMSGVYLWTGGGSVYSKGNRANPRSLDKPSFTVTAGVPGRLLESPSPPVLASEYKYVGGESDKRRAGYVFRRQLTPKECLILQGFRPNYVLIGNKTARYKQIGNAVPPPVARAIGLAISNHSGPAFRSALELYEEYRDGDCGFCKCGEYSTLRDGLCYWCDSGIS